MWSRPTTTRGNLLTKIRIGLAGCGFVSELHMYAFRRVYGVDVEVAAVAARGGRGGDFAGHHGVPKVYRRFAELIADRGLDVIAICTPPQLLSGRSVARIKAAQR